MKVIKYLKDEGGLTTYKELFNTAITVLYWCFKEVRNGRIIASLDEETMRYKELSMPALQVVAAAGANSSRASRMRQMDDQRERDEVIVG
jgi:hypothetical protein